jgi:hypothetical protein
MASKRDEESQEEKNHRYNRRYNAAQRSGGCCTKTKCILFFVFLALLGGAAGALVGVFGIEQIKSWVGLGPTEEGSEDTGTGTGNDGNNTGTPAYVFSQCPSSGDCCNGLASNCDLKVNEVLYATVHNANHDNRTAFFNNVFPLEDALTAGYRGLMIDVCKCPNEQDEEEVIFCHGMCGIGTRDPAEVFTNINTFLSSNSKDMLIINFELSVGNPTPAELWAVLDGVDGISSKTYDYTEGSSWPTMKQMQNINKQLILFKHGGLSCLNNPNSNGCVSNIEEFHRFAVETKYSFANVEEVEDENNSCVEDRGTGGTKEFYAVNNFVGNSVIGSPSEAGSETVNEKVFLTNRLAECEAITNLKPNYIAVDFWHLGDVIEVVQEENKVRGA